MVSFPLCEQLSLYILVYDLFGWGTTTRLSDNAEDVNFTMTFSLGQSVWKVEPFLSLTFQPMQRYMTGGDDWQANHLGKKIWHQNLQTNFVSYVFLWKQWWTKIVVSENTKKESSHHSGAAPWSTHKNWQIDLFINTNIQTCGNNSTVYYYSGLGIDYL